MCIRTYHPYKDTSLSDRTEIVRSWLKRGYYGYLHSFHSNAISSSNSKAKLEATQGFMVFTTKKDNLSDRIATIHHHHVLQALPDWNVRRDTVDGDVDHEANFQILRETDLPTFYNFGAILEEWGFHTSKKDCEFIVSETGRNFRVLCALKTAVKVKAELER
jgi:N-acetylmuramoyl-L-alanine amidase